MGFSAIGRLSGRGLSGMRGYSRGGAGTATAQYGDTITYNVPGQPPGQIWLEQYVNGNLGYNGPFNIPMNPYTLSAKDQVGSWVSNAYTLVNGQKGTLLERSTLYVTGPATTQPITQSGSFQAPVTPLNVSCPGYTSTEIQSIRTAFNDPSWLPAGCSPGSTPGGGGGGGSAGSGTVAVTINTAPSIPGALPSTGAVGASYNQNVQCLQGSYRFILATGGGYATGANRAGCSATNSANCDPQYFNTLLDAIAYAIQNGETPYKVLSAQEPWDLMNCTIPVDTSRIYGPSGSLGGFSWELIALVAGLVYFVGKSRR
jgi:hypothetical protein